MKKLQSLFLSSLFFLGGCPNRKAGFDIDARKELQMKSTDKLYIVGEDNRDSTNRIVNELKAYYIAVAQPLTHVKENADILVKVSSSESEEKKIMLKETAKNLGKPVKKKVSYVNIKVSYERNILGGKKSISLMEVRKERLEKDLPNYAKKFLELMHNTKENIKKRMKW